MNDKILQRILKETELPQLLEVLSEKLNPSDFQSLLLEVYQKRALKNTPAFLQKLHVENRFTKPSLLSPLVQLEFDQLAFKVGEDIFEPISLSPLAPLGSCSSIAKVDQKNIVSTSRNFEVIADPTNVMALEGSARRKELLKENPKDSTIVNLCCSHRVVRSQFFDRPNSFAHFQLFGLGSAGKDIGNFGFEIKTLEDHLTFYLRLMTVFSSFHFKNIEVLVLPIEKRLESKIETLFEKLSNDFPEVKFQIDTERTNGIGYYQTLCFTINASPINGEQVHLVDGGVTDWIQQLLSNHKERYMISAIGSERIGLLFYGGNINSE